MKSFEFLQQGIAALPAVGIRDTCFLRTCDRTLGNLKEPDTFGAFFWVDGIPIVTLADGSVGTILLAIAAHDAIFYNHICHSLIFSLLDPHIMH
jgi:hypothetical protein